MCRLSILSYTNNYIYGKSSLLEYTSLTKEHKDEVDRLSSFSHSQFTSESDQLLSKTGEKTTGSSIRFIEDFHLVLLRHWNLHDSLFYSSYVATKLGVWKEKGRKRLTNLLVKMG